MVRHKDGGAQRPADAAAHVDDDGPDPANRLFNRHHDEQVEQHGDQQVNQPVRS